MSNKSETRSGQTPLGELERSLIDEFVRARGYDPDKLADLPEREREKVLADADIYVSGKLAEVEARSHFVGELHDGGPGIMKRSGE